MNITKELTRIYKATDLDNTCIDEIAEAIVSATDLLMSARKQGAATTAIIKRIGSLKKLIVDSKAVEKEVIYNLQFTTWTEEVETYLKNTGVIAEEVVVVEAEEVAVEEVVATEEEVTYNELTADEKVIVDTLKDEEVTTSEENVLSAMRLISGLTEYGKTRTMRVLKKQTTPRQRKRLRRMFIPLPVDSLQEE